MHFVIESSSLKRSCLLKALTNNLSIEIVRDFMLITNFNKLKNLKFPFVIIIDLDYVDKNEIKLFLIRIKALSEKPYIVFISFNKTECEIRINVKYTNSKFFDKNSDVEELIEFISCLQTKDFLKLNSNNKKVISKPENFNFKRNNFSNREKEVFSLICEGKSNKEIAEKLHVIQRTVEHHKTQIFKKANVKNCSELLVKLMKVTNL